MRYWCFESRARSAVASPAQLSFYAQNSPVFPTKLIFTFTVCNLQQAVFFVVRNRFALA